MKTENFLIHTQELLQEILRFEFPADAVISRYFRNNRALGQNERALLAETVYAIVREKNLLMHLAQSGRGPMLRRLALLGWQGERGLLGQVLNEHEREWLHHVHQVDTAHLPQPLQHNLPDWLANQLQAELGEQFWPFVKSTQQSAPLDLRVNTLKIKREQAQLKLQESGIQSQMTSYSPWGLRVAGKPSLQKNALFLDGSIEVQDEGSQLLALLLSPKRGDLVVDFCAGAGGKTLALGAAMRNTGRLYAWDVSAKRLDSLKPRLARSGLSNVHPVVITHERDARVKRLYGKADRVLVDAPCSGLGTLRRNPDLKWRQTLDAIDELIQKQRAIFASACRLLKSGGLLVYATCSILSCENEENVCKFDEEHPEFEKLDAADLLAAQNISDAKHLVNNGYLRLWPQIHQTDGFFAAVWKKR